MTLTSSHNPLLKKVRQAVEEGRAMDSGSVVAEGPHLLSEALRSSWKVEQVLVSEDDRQRHDSLLASAAAKGIESIEVAARTFRSLSNTGHGQGILSILRPQVHSWEKIFTSEGPVVVLDAIQDPGNAGTILRSVEAFGGAAVIFTTGCVRVSNGKLLRATAGSVFRVPFRENEERDEVIRRCVAANRSMCALIANSDRTLLGKSLIQSALVVGSEGKGVSQELLAASEAVSIPTEGVESLNAAVACSIALFEAARQRKFV